MATVSRFDVAQFGLSQPLNRTANVPATGQPFRELAVGASTADTPSPAMRTQALPLDERLQPCGTAFECEAFRSSADTVTLWHIRPVRTRFLAVDLPVGESIERVVVRVTRCESFGLDFAVRGDVMGS